VNAKKPKRRRFSSAYDAWWFLYEHPKLNRCERTEVDTDKVEAERADAKKRRKMFGHSFRPRVRFLQDKGGNWWKEWRDLTVPAVAENLDIHYAKVDGRGRVNDDPAKNVNTACWLECGEVIWSHPYADKPEWRQGERDYKMHCHDIDLDCGGKTFDEAIVKLARKVLRKFGDYSAKKGTSS
jgi:hypothetical protein